MSLQVMCPNLLCRKILLVPDDARGKNVKCQHCGMVLKVPENPVDAPSSNQTQSK